MRDCAKSGLNNLDVVIGLIGERAELTYDYEYLGTGPESIGTLMNGENDFAKALKKAERPAFIVGTGVLARPDAAAILAQIAKLGRGINLITESWNGFNVLHTAASRVGALDVGFVPGENGRDFQSICEGAQSREIEVIYNLGADEFDVGRLGGAFMIYQGHHGDAGAKVADVILPAACYTEQSGIYVNLEGRVQMAARATFPPGDAREDWAILRAVSGAINDPLPYDDLAGLRQRIFDAFPHLGAFDHLERMADHPSGETTTLMEHFEASSAGTIETVPFLSSVPDFFRTNAIARASKTMAECAAALAVPAAIAAE